MLLDRFQQQLAQYYPHQTDFLVGLSGGVDSVVLLDLMIRAKKSVRAVHIHHGLSDNADSWAVFCGKLCEHYRIDCHIRKVKLGQGNGIEAEARNARYQAISEIIHTNEVLVTAHHQDDQAETFLLALKRGSGVKGLSAMQAVSFAHQFPQFRPLLIFTKQEIIDYAKQQGLNWVNDESNQSDDFERNFLRNQILPKLNARWQHFNAMVARSAQHCAEQQQLLTELLADELESRCDFTQRTFSLQNFAQNSPLKQAQLLRLWLEKCGEPMPTKTQLAQILRDVVQAEADKNPQFQLQNKLLRRYQQHLYLTEQNEKPLNFQAELNRQPLILPDNLGELQYVVSGAIDYKICQETYRFPLPPELTPPFSVRFGVSGKVACYHKPHREEMKKIWQALSVPVWLRQRVPLIFAGDKLVCVCWATPQRKS